MNKNKLVKDRITRILNEKDMTTEEIKYRLYNTKTNKGRPSKKGMPTSHQLQMILSVHYRKVGFCNQANQTIWGNR